MAGSIAAFAFCYLAINISKTHGALQLLFISIGLLLLTNGFAICRSMAEDADASASTIRLLETSITTTTWTFYVSIVYFMLMFLYSVLMRMLPEKLRRKR